MVLELSATAGISGTATEIAEISEVFDETSHTLQWAQGIFLSSDETLWKAHRNTGILPRVASDTAGSERGRTEFLEGARLLRLNTARKPLAPQQLWLCDMLSAEKPDGTPLNTMNGVLIPRRSSKTTSILAVALGRCALRDDYRVGFTLATTGAKARERFRYDIVMPLELLYPDKDTRPFTIRKSSGSEAIIWPNGSVFSVLTPSGEAFRSDGFDLIVIDEAGEASIELGEDLIAGALSTTDTKPEAQFIIAGTAAEYREGNLLWDVLEDGRNEVPGVGIIEYSAEEPVTAEMLKTWEEAKPLVLAAHPGIGTLTTLDVIKERHRVFKPANFLREYLSIFGKVGTGNGALDLEKWGLGAIITKSLPRPPKDYAVAIAVHPEQLSACIVAAWRSGTKARVLILKHKPGVQWLAEEAAKASLKLNRPLIYDEKAELRVQLERMAKMSPRPLLAPQSFKDVGTAAALISSELDAQNLEHYNQPELNEAVRLAVWRRYGRSRLFGRVNDEDDIIVLEAAAIALRVYDATPRRKFEPPRF